MMTGHTKFCPDRFFGLIKKAYRRSNISSLHDIEKMVSNSSIAGNNLSVLTIDCAGKRDVIWYRWNDFLSQYFTIISGISKYHHFQFKSSAAGSVVIKEHSKAPEKVVNIVVDQKELDKIAGKMPEVITPTGMSFERQKYLFEKIRPFCSPETADLTCPSPYKESSTISKEPVAVPDDTENQVKSKRKCSQCRKTGHTKTVKGVITCPTLLEK